MVGADRPPLRFSTIFCSRSNITSELSDVSSPVSIGAVGIYGQPRPEVSRPVRPQRAVSSLNRLRAEALATLPLASMPAFYPEHAYDIAGLLKALRELPSGEEVRELRDHIKRLNKAHSLAVARRDDPRWDLVSFAGQRDLGPALLGRGRLTEIRRYRDRAGSSFPFASLDAMRPRETFSRSTMAPHESRPIM